MSGVLNPQQGVTAFGDALGRLWTVDHRTKNCFFRAFCLGIFEVTLNTSIILSNTCEKQHEIYGLWKHWFQTILCGRMISIDFPNMILHCMLDDFCMIYESEV